MWRLTITYDIRLPKWSIEVVQYNLVAFWRRMGCATVSEPYEIGVIIHD